MGYPKKKLVAELRIDNATFGSWERGERQPTKKFLERLDSFIVSLDLRGES